MLPCAKGTSGSLSRIALDFGGEILRLSHERFVPHSKLLKLHLHLHLHIHLEPAMEIEYRNVSQPCRSCGSDPDHISNNNPESAVQTLSFYELPAELGNRIYTYALVRDEHTQLVSSNPPHAHIHFTTKQHFKAAVVQPAITRTARTICSEALPVFYGANIFELPYNNYEVVSWLQAIGVAN